MTIIFKKQETEDKVLDMPKFNLNNSGKPVSSPQNVVLILEAFESKMTLLGYNEFTGAVEKLDKTPWGTPKGEWDSDDTSLFSVYIDKLFHFTPKKDYIEDAVLEVARRWIFNPVKERIESLDWDGVSRVQYFFHKLLGCEDSIYTREVSQMFLTGLIGRVYKPGIKFDNVPVLIGPQGIGKSTVARRLLPDAFTDTPISFGKTQEDYRMLKYVCVVEIPELQGLKQSDINRIKAFLGASHDTYRELYKTHKRQLRHNVFIATGNSKAFLGDFGVERRFYPLNCGENVVEQHPMDVSDDYFLQILAEARLLFYQYGIMFPSRTTSEKLEEIQFDFKEEDVERELINEFLDEFPAPDCWNRYTLSERKKYYNMWKGYEKETREYWDATGENLVTVTYTSELAYILFDEKTGGGRNSKHASKIRDVLDHREDFIAVQNKRPCSTCSPTRVYKRIEATE
ncbi:virulence-associated E family protein [Streptococcus mitis]|uniref:virulence-associated E family protein n=1 Tax=Streptococcus mitis TaxID=28037 RepID=UPI001C57DBD5|nr:virulence-associated E family protein [Streptococcus mitis]MBW3454208.1 virulence-associated E family protein [Streptococcus mitis]